jgi:hypothetical protein
MKNLLFIQSFIEGDYDKIYIKLEILLGLWLIVGIAVIIDLFYGIKKAKRLQQARTSIGLRKTVKKSNQYGAFLTFAFLFDIILSVWFYMPFATALTSAYLIFIEARSVWESMEKNDQDSYKEGAKDFIEIFQNLKDEDRSRLLDVIKEKLEETKKENNV